MRDLSNIKNLIIKIGSSSLCDDEGNINKENFKFNSTNSIY